MQKKHRLKRKKKKPSEKEIVASFPNATETDIKRMYGLFLFCCLICFTRNHAFIDMQTMNSMLGRCINRETFFYRK